MNRDPAPLLQVRVVGFNSRDALLIVDGIRVRIRKRPGRVTWLCDECGRFPAPTCPHQLAAAVTPADPSRMQARRPRQRNDTNPTERNHP